MIKKILLFIVLPFFLVLTGIIVLTMSTVTTTSNTHNQDSEQAINFQLDGVISNKTLKQINFIEKADAEESYAEISGDVNSGKITNPKYITWKKGNLELVTVGNGGSANGSLMTGTGAQGAADWARAIAADDSFTYGEGQRAHRGGCYFCQTNTGPRKKKKERSGESHYVTDSHGKKHTYEKTYCCNPFVFASYAHGANDPKIQKACYKGRCGGLTPHDWTQYGCFKNVGHPSYNDLQVGDVLLKVGKHAAIYVGNGELAEASGGGWGKDTIRCVEMSRSRYAGFGTVCRYTGSGKGGTVMNTSGGTISSSSSGSGVQGALNWAKKIANDNSYFYKCVSPCHLCHSNNPKNYCCASFVRAAYAHGAGDEYMKKKCSNSEAGYVSGLVSAMRKSGNFKNMGKLSKSQLKPGDVLVKGSQHVEMYYGNGKQVGAHGIQHHTKADSISINNLSIAYTSVWRYQIGGAANVSNPTYTSKHILGTISKSEVTSVGSCGTGSHPTAQSVEYMGSGKTAVLLNNTTGSVDGNSGKLLIFENGKLKKSGSAMNYGHANSLCYVDGLFSVGTQRNNAKQIAQVNESNLSKKTTKLIKFRNYGMGYDTDTDCIALSDGGKITISNDSFSVKQNVFQKIVTGGHTQDCGAKRGVVYECISYDKHKNNIINMYSESSGGYLGSYKVGFSCELEGCDVDEEGRLIILAHMKGSHANYIYRTKNPMALTESATMGNGSIEGLTVRQYIAITIKYSKNTAALPVERAMATSFVPSAENLRIANRIASALAQRGYTQAAIAGVLGNLHHESGGLKTSSIEKGGGGGHGLAQWTGGRWDNLQNFAQARGKPWTDLDVQIEFLCHELDGYKSMEQKMKNVMDVREATKIFMDEFERPGVPAFENRVKYALGYYGNTSAVTSTQCKADLLVSVDTDINKCVVQGTVNGRKVEAAGDIQYDGKTITLSAKGLGAGNTEGEYASGQLSGMRTSYPESGNKWYFDKSINPFPRNSKGGNCTWYAYGRFCEIAGKKIKMSSYGNAVTFYDSFPGCQKGKTPQVGAIICWGYGSAHGHPGHVAVVEEVKTNGDIVCSNSGWSGSKFWMSTHRKSENYSMHHNNDVFRGFIYQP